MARIGEVSIAFLLGCTGQEGGKSEPADSEHVPDDSGQPSETGDDSGGGDTGHPMIDADGDGVSPADGDCDDLDPARSPEVIEKPGDGFDQDCDGLDVAVLPMAGVERSGDLWDGRMGDTLAAGDLDADGVDDLAIAFPGSGAPPDTKGVGATGAGVETHLGPLNDLDHGTWHGALEEDLISLVGHGTSVGDTDGDGLDDLAYSVPLGDGLDFNTGLIYVVHGPATDETLPETKAPVTIVGEERGQGFGYTMAPRAVDYDGDGLADLVIGREAPDSDEVARAYVFAGPFPVDRMESDAALTVMADEVGDRLGSALDSGDFDGDGHLDLAIGAFWSDANGSDSGQVSIIGGSLTGSHSVSEATAQFNGEGAGDYAGHDLASLGDLDGDGNDDLGIGALFASYEGEHAGRAYVLHGPLSGAASLSDADAAFLGSRPGDWTGRAIAATGDVNGDGMGDLVVSATQDVGANGLFARVSLFAGPFAGPVSPEDATRIWVSSTFADLAGESLAVGNFNGSGGPDLAIGAPTDSAGAAYGGRVNVLIDPFD